MELAAHHWHDVRTSPKNECIFCYYTGGAMMLSREFGDSHLFTFRLEVLQVAVSLGYRRRSALFP